jgi:ribonuclease G
MSKDILINVEPREVRVAVVEENRLTDFFVERKDAQQLVGNIYKGKVTAIVPGIGAAFVDIGLEKNGFLYVADVMTRAYDSEEEILPENRNRPSPVKKGRGSIEEKLKINDAVLVQVVKEPLGRKGARLTTQISLPGKHIVIMPNDPHIGISKRISDKAQRMRIRSILEKLRIPQEIGVIVRTAGEKAESREFERDLRYLLRLWSNISRAAQKAPMPFLLHEESELVIRILRDVLTEEVRNVFIDSRDEYKKALRFLNYFSRHLRTKLSYYAQDTPLFKKMGIDREIEKLYKRLVQLRSGGYIVIEQTESLVSVDVNTGKFIGHPGKQRKSLEETAFVVNKEAAEEIARQIRLRNLGGIIIIDFIDMESKEYEKKVFSILQEVLKEDKAKIKIYPFSDLGLVEMTRERRRRSIESVFYEECPYCQGRGRVKSLTTMANTALRDLRFFLNEKKSRRVSLVVHQQLHNILLKEYWRYIQEIGRRYRAHIDLKTEPRLHIEDIKIS